mmetsp:Transcript_57871/g.163365  ORF Transcript_57871/g.163365 Transcript_57871/m.163365 type:complete len:243 (+) Transcript_57871:894-1622(+)
MKNARRRRFTGPAACSPAGPSASACLSSPTAPTASTASAGSPGPSATAPSRAGEGMLRGPTSGTTTSGTTTSMSRGMGVSSASAPSSPAASTGWAPAAAASPSSRWSPTRGCVSKSTPGSCGVGKGSIGSCSRRAARSSASQMAPKRSSSPLGGAAFLAGVFSVMSSRRATWRLPRSSVLASAGPVSSGLTSPSAANTPSAPSLSSPSWPSPSFLSPSDQKAIISRVRVSSASASKSSHFFA